MVFLINNSDILKTIIVASRKGGVGKSTVCINLAIHALQSTKKKVALLDLDPQRSLGVWFDARKTNPEVKTKRLSLVESDKADFALELEHLKDSGHEYVFIDTPPIDKAWLARVMAFSDLLVIPTKASLFDMAAVVPTIEAAIEKKISVRWLLSGVVLPRAEVKAVAEELLQIAKVCPGVVKELSDVVRATQAGLGISEFKPESPASRAYYLNWLDIELELSKANRFKHKF